MTKIGTASAQEYIDFSTTDEITFHVDNTERFSVKSTGANVTGDLTVSGSYDLTGGDGISISGKTLSVDISELSGMDWSGLLMTHHHYQVETCILQHLRMQTVIIMI